MSAPEAPRLAGFEPEPEGPTLLAPRIDTLPISVIDIEAQTGTRRDGTDHAGDSSRGMYSHFPTEIGTLAVQLFLREASLVFDPFAGWGERAAICQALGKPYHGFDISQESIDEARRVYGVENHRADSLSADIPPFDGLLTCPPYWNLELYGPEGLDRLPTWPQFLAGLERVFQRAWDAALPGATFCIYVGDWRAKHRYYDLTYQTQKMFEGFGAYPFDVVVGSRAKVTKIKILLPQAIRLGYTAKVHETLLVYRKPR